MFKFRNSKIEFSGSSLPMAIVNASDRYNERNDCVIKAIAIATNISYGKVHKTCKKNGRENRKGTSGKTLKKTVSDLGFKLVPVKGTGKTFKTYQPPTNESYLVFSKSHCVAAVDGLIRDWSSDTNRRVIAQFRIERV